METFSFNNSRSYFVLKKVKLVQYMDKMCRNIEVKKHLDEISCSCWFPSKCSINVIRKTSPVLTYPSGISLSYTIPCEFPVVRSWNINNKLLSVMNVATFKQVEKGNNHLAIELKLKSGWLTSRAAFLTILLIFQKCI